MAATTTNYKYQQPTVGGDADVWGGYLNDGLAALDKLSAAITTGGSAAAYTLTTGQSLTAYATGQSFIIKASFTCNAAATLNVDDIGAKNITKNGTTATVSGDIVSGGVYTVSYDGTQFQIISGSGSLYQQLDATLTALAALSWSSGSPLLQFTAADTVSLTLTPSVTSVTTGSVIVNGSTVPANGMYLSAANTVAFAANSTLRMFLNSAGLNLSSQVTPILLQACSVSAPAIVIRAADTGTGFYSIGTNNWGWAGNGTKYLDMSSTLFAFSAPVQAQMALSSETTGTLTSASANKKILATGGITLPNSVFAAQDAILISGNGTARTITRGSGVTMYIAGVDSATGTLSANGNMGVIWRTTSICELSGNIA